MIITLDQFQPRDYQLNALSALEHGFKNVIACWPRRSGKGAVAWSWMVRQAILKPALYWYVLPTFALGRRVIWDQIDAQTGVRFMDFIPAEFIASTNKATMTVTLKNRSILQIVGSDSYDNLMGASVAGCVFDEYSLQDPNGYRYITPMLRYNNGWSLFVSTPRGKNHFYDLYQIAIQNPDSFYVDKLTIDQTKHIPLSRIEEDIKLGIISEEFAAQEYWTSFELGIENSVFGKKIDELRLRSRIGVVDHDPRTKVHTFWDIGVGDSTAIIFAQIVGSNVHVIDYYENSGKGLDHYADVLQQKRYLYGRHYAPHDIQVREWAGGAQTRFDVARSLGITFTIAPNIPKHDGIELGRAIFSRVWINEYPCQKLINALEHYHYKKDERTKHESAEPEKDWSNHGADAWRYMAVALPLIGESLTAQELDKRYQQAMYGDQGQIPRPFRQPWEQ